MRRDAEGCERREHCCCLFRTHEHVDIDIDRDARLTVIRERDRAAERVREPGGQERIGEELDLLFEAELVGSHSLDRMRGNLLRGSR